MTIDNALSSPIDVERHRTLSFPRNQDSCSISSPVDSRSSIVTNEPVTASSLDLPGPVYISLLSHREAFLLRSYISKLAPWVRLHYYEWCPGNVTFQFSTDGRHLLQCDVCDIACHFATEVPRRALEVPMVLYAVLAVSSRHQAILSGSTDEVEASTFHGRCLELLISALSARGNVGRQPPSHRRDPPNLRGTRQPKRQEMPHRRIQQAAQHGLQVLLVRRPRRGGQLALPAPGDLRVPGAPGAARAEPGQLRALVGVRPFRQRVLRERDYLPVRESAAADISRPPGCRRRHARVGSVAGEY